MHSSARSIKHSSFVIERRYDFDPAQVYRAWVHPEAKARWFNGPPDKWSEQVREMDVRIGGGASTIQQYLRQRLIDELHIAISPVLLGGGERLFDGIDMRTLGYGCVDFVASEKATHVVLRHQRVADT